MLRFNSQRAAGSGTDVCRKRTMGRIARVLRSIDEIAIDYLFKQSDDQCQRFSAAS
jgi:hypothetical protein